ncbi:TetR/AcrR family transcriptional regulator [Microscilla marina]|uniref:Probable transcriptional regulator, putative n=1 Tax=Microscilla marina ATCC 23134 TaxID=313606 RepID=A1ZYZ0_MICM2|nr:TetR/AcrR family transcriptional regulator [Microscilla marina]EAY24426.1 probable transcriptional regulator, putative [Microscilla marina ATCC 23134]
MAKKKPKQVLLEATVSLMGEKGYFGTGLSEVLSLSQAPKGSLYYYFPQGKNQLMIEAIQLAGTQVNDVLRQMLVPQNDLKVALQQIFSFFAQQLLSSDFKKSCPVATVAAESASLAEEVRLACEQVYASWHTSIQQFLEQKGLSNTLAEKYARFSLNLIEGNLLMSRVFKDTKHLEQGLEVLLEVMGSKE